MKKIIFVTTMSLLFLTSCRVGISSTTSGLDNQVFLEFIGHPDNYKGGVDVNVDDKLNFKAEVNKDHADRPKGNIYAVSAGNHTVTVSYGNKVIYKKQLYLASQVTQKIIL